MIVKKKVTKERLPTIKRVYNIDLKVKYKIDSIINLCSIPL